MKKRKILVVTGIRSDYDIVSTVCRQIEDHPELELQILVTGAHLSTQYGLTVSQIESDGFKIVDRIESLLNSDTLGSRVKGLATQLAGMVQTATRENPDMLLVLGDREEAMSTALLGAYMNIPVAHIAGGDRVIGNVDDQVRHAVTKLAHLHFVTCEESAERVRRLGEQPFRIFNTGNPGLDRLLSEPSMTDAEMAAELGMKLSPVEPLILVIQHVISTESEDAYRQMRATLDSVAELKMKTVIVYPNSDAGGQEIIRAIREFGEFDFVKSLPYVPRALFVNLLRRASCLLGNSSAGILEAPILKLPVVNVGNRQKGRLHAENVQFVPHEKSAIVAAVRRATNDETYREMVKNCSNPYGDGHSAKRIADLLASVKLGEELLLKDITY